MKHLSRLRDLSGPARRGEGSRGMGRGQGAAHADELHGAAAHQVTRTRQRLGAGTGVVRDGTTHHLALCGDV
jgi:hypothetical protein